MDLRRIVTENPIKSMGAFLGGIIGYLLPSGIESIIPMASQDPAVFIISYPVILIIQIVTGLIGGAVGVLIGSLFE